MMIMDFRSIDNVSQSIQCNIMIMVFRSIDKVPQSIL